MATGKLLVNITKPFYNQQRSFIKNYQYSGGIEYYGFKYFPRKPDFKDPPYTPERLFLVTRIKPVKGTNPVERRVLETLNIDGHIKQRGHITIVKNVPEVNKYLWKIKHLVEIVPIKFVNGLPKGDDLTGTWLKSNGEFIVSHKLKVPEDRLQATQEFEKTPNKFNSTVLKKYLRGRWDDPIEGGIVD